MPTDPIELAVHLKDRRDEMKMIWQDEYEGQVKPVREMIRRHATQRGLSLADVTLSMARDLTARNHNPNWVFAAFVDECEQEGSPNVPR